MKKKLQLWCRKLGLITLMTCVLITSQGYASDSNKSTAEDNAAKGTVTSDEDDEGVSGLNNDQVELPVTLIADVDISGKITDENGQGLPGASVVEKGTANGTTSDLDGNYKLSVPEGITLVISFVGYETQEILLGSQSIIDAKLVVDAEQLDEIVVIGYGTAKKSDLTGSVVSVSSEQLTLRPVASVGQALQGQASGVLVRTNSAAPGGGTSIVIRGQNSVNSGSGPLYIVDGVPLSNIDNIPVEDIKSIEVLKDASSTAIYGSRGANGVILISSKKGISGTPKITYNTRFTSQSVNADLNLMNAAEFAEFFTDFEIANGTDPSNIFYNGSSTARPTVAQAGEGTDWFDVITQNGLIQNHQVSVSGGSDVNRYSVSLNYLDHKGIVIGGKYNRFGLRVSNETDVTKWLTTSINLYATHEKLRGSGENTTGEGGGGSINAAIKMAPALPIYDENGAYYANNLPGAQGIENPFARVTEESNFNRNWDVIGNFGLTFKILENLSFRSSIGGDFNNFKRTNYNPSTTVVGALVSGSASLANNNTSHFINENIFNYKKTFDAHSFDVVAGVTYEEQISENFAISATDFFTDAFKFNNIGAASNFGQPSSGKTKWQLASYLGRVNYSMKGKYLISASARYDGSSRFGEGNKWGFFPAVSGAWIASEESFLKDQKTISFLKVRAGWGRTGNQNIGLQQSLATFSLANYPIGTSIQSGVAAGGLANTDLKWETTENLSFAIDFSILDKVDFSVDYYQKSTSDLLLNVALIETSGFSGALLNTGELKNTGFEFSAEAFVVNKQDFKVRLKGDIFLNKNEIVSLVGDPTQSWRIGQALGVSRSYISDGLIRNQADLDAFSDSDGNPINGAQIGDYKAVDLNDDGVISGDDLAVTFDPNPDFAYSLNTGFTFKRFSMDLFFYGTQGNQILNNTKSYLVNIGVVRTNMSKEIINNYWTPENTNADFARLGTNTTSFATQRNLYEDGSFFRLQNIRIGYSLPENPIFSSANVYFSAQNVFTITGYSGFDPDVNSTPGNNSFGVDRNAYPIPKSFTLGLQINF